jgi:hypothetical protein
MKSYHVAASQETPIEDVLAVFAKYKIFGLGPTEVTRMVQGEGSGLLVHNDPENSWCCYIPDDKVEQLRSEELITAIIPTNPVGFA